jgi:hypothetical protein
MFAEIVGGLIADKGGEIADPMGGDRTVVVPQFGQQQRSHEALHPSFSFLRYRAARSDWSRQQKSLSRNKERSRHQMLRSYPLAPTSCRKSCTMWNRALS